MILYFTPDELSVLLTEISRVMKPGGYFEVVDTNYTIQNPGPLCTKLVNTESKLLLFVYVYIYSTLFDISKRRASSIFINILFKL